MSKSVDLKEFVAGFLLEADEHLHTVSRNLVDTSEALKKGLAEPRAIRELFRSIHTIKGLASMVGAEPIVEITHEMESILRVADRTGGLVSENALNLLLQGTRAVEERVNAISKVGVDKIPAASKQLIEALALEQNTGKPVRAPKILELELPPAILKSLSASDKEQMFQAGQSGRRVMLIEFQPSEDRASRGFSITSVRDNLGKLGDLVKVVPQSAPKSPTGIAFILLLVTSETTEVLEAATGMTSSEIRTIDVGYTPAPESPAFATVAQEESEEFSSNDHSSIRVDVRRLDEALERLSELVVTRYRLVRAAAQLSEKGVDTRELNNVIADHTRQLKRLRTAITESRMVPLAELLQRVPLVVRGLTQGSDKEVNVVIHASSAEVDKAVADKVFPAIIHLIRNSVDHAIETTADRKIAGKEEAGTILIECDDSSGTSLVMTISDDGRGVDREAVARKSGKPVAKTDEELLAQITLPGLSTRDQVTHTSGRGMGMDIVKKTIEMLGGVLTLKTTPGKGTIFTLKVPVSITIIDVFSFVSDGQLFVAPVSMIEEIIEIDPARIVKAPMPGIEGPRTNLIQHRGDAVPIFSLDVLLKRKSGIHPFPKKAMIVQRGSGAVAFGVDRMIGQQEVVVRPLDEKLFRLPGMAGATDLGDGLPTLVLDLATLGSAVLSDAEVLV